MLKLSQKEFDDALKLHAEWLIDNNKGERFNLNGLGVDLSHLDLNGVNLSKADLYGVHLYGANLRGVNLRGANLDSADLRCANLRYADMRNADMYHAVKIDDANLFGAKMYTKDIMPVYYHNIDITVIEFMDAELSEPDACFTKENCGILIEHIKTRASVAINKLKELRSEEK